MLLTNINDEYILKISFISFILFLQNPTGWFFKRTAIEKKLFKKIYLNYFCTGIGIKNTAVNTNYYFINRGSLTAKSTVP